jgi:O-antigen/teichoic acid export membrane protein
VSGGSVAASLNESSPDLIIGKVLGATETGLFNKALGLTTMVKNLVMLPLWKVLLPYFSERSRSGENIASVYLRVVSLVTGFIWPALLVAGIAADPIVRLLLGEQWLGAIPLARILCIASAIAAVSSPLSSLLVGRSRADLYLRTAVVACLLRVAFLTATAPFAIEAVAWGFVVSSLAYVGYGAHILRRYMEIGTRQLLKSAQRSAMLTAAMVPFSVGAIWISAQLALSPINTLLTVSIASAACWLLTVSRIHPDAATEMRRIVNKLAPLMRFRRHEGKVS